MGLELIAALIFAFCMGGLAYGLRKLVPALPKWMIPGAAALGLFGFALWSEYSWFARSRADLPEGAVIAWTETRGQPFRPWTYVVPMVHRYAVLDLRQVQVHPANPALRIIPVYFLGRWERGHNGMMAFDCAAGRQIVVTRGIEITGEGLLKGADWDTPPAGDGFQGAACKSG